MAIRLAWLAGATALGAIFGFILVGLLLMADGTDEERLALALVTVVVFLALGAGLGAAANWLGPALALGVGMLLGGLPFVVGELSAFGFVLAGTIFTAALAGGWAGAGLRRRR
jgi:hypothetical protein